MSIFTIKIVAMIFMLFDHIAILLGYGEGWGIIEFNTYYILRGFGRVVYPIFAFSLVNGFCKTKNIKEYLSRLLLFASISQIPFTLALYTVNLMPLSLKSRTFMFRHTGSIVISIGLILAYYVLQEKKRFDKFYILIFFALFFSNVFLVVEKIWVIYSGSLNVFYTLFIGLLILYGINKLSTNKSMKLYKKIVLILSIAMATLYIAIRSDYGIAGVALICSLYFVRQNLPLQLLVICAWGIILYGFIYNNISNAIFTCLSCLIIATYNGKKGPSMKYLFYAFYPAHLLVLGILNILFKFSII